jgi:phospholipid-binding lipoprotein MlaA
VLPFFGPSTTRDGVGLIGDYFTDPEFWIFNNPPTNWLVFGLRVVNTRSNPAGADQFFRRQRWIGTHSCAMATLQLRRNQIYDGNPPSDDSRVPHGARRSNSRRGSWSWTSCPPTSAKPEPPK